MELGRKTVAKVKQNILGEGGAVGDSYRRG